MLNIYYITVEPKTKDHIMTIDEIIRRIEKKLDANWPVEEDEIRALINFIRENKPKDQ